jgi:type VI secretion system protein VasD
VVAFFRNAGKDSTWKLVIPKKQWKNTDPVKIEARDNTLNLVDATDDTIRRNAPQQSVPNPPKPKPAAVTEYGTQAG